MQAVAASAVILGLFGLGGWEIVLILAVVIILLGARQLPVLGRGLRLGIFEFRRATREVTDEIDGAASEAGRSVGGIYGKPAAEALTTDNRVAELYDPALLRDKAKLHKPWKVTGFTKLYACIRRFLRAICGGSGR
jgi:sec-independent protein translocase protein TatA